MNFLETLTLILVALKVLNLIDWSWWLIIIPILLSFVYTFGYFYGKNKKY